MLLVSSVIIIEFVLQGCSSHMTSQGGKSGMTDMPIHSFVSCLFISGIMCILCTLDRYIGRHIDQHSSNVLVDISTDT